MPSTTELSVQAAMPTCQYTIRRSSTDGPEIKYAKVGDSVYHTWQCSTTIPGSPLLQYLLTCTVFNVLYRIL